MLGVNLVSGGNKGKKRLASDCYWWEFRCFVVVRAVMSGLFYCFVVILIPSCVSLVKKGTRNLCWTSRERPKGWCMLDEKLMNFYLFFLVYRCLRYRLHISYFLIQFCCSFHFSSCCLFSLNFFNIIIIIHVVFVTSLLILFFFSLTPFCCSNHFFILFAFTYFLNIIIIPYSIVVSLHHSHCFRC